MHRNFFQTLILISLFFAIGYACRGPKCMPTTMWTRRGVGPLKLMTLRTRLNKKVSPVYVKQPLKYVSGSIANTKVNVSDRFPRDSALLPLSALNGTEVLKSKLEGKEDSERKRPLFRNGNRQRQRQRCRPKFTKEQRLLINEKRLNESETKNEEDQSASKDEQEEILQAKNETNKISVRVGGTVEHSLPIKAYLLNETGIKNETSLSSVKVKPDVSLKTPNETAKIVVRVGGVVESSISVEKNESDIKLRFMGGSGNASDEAKNRTGSKDEKPAMSVKVVQNESKSSSEPIVKSDELKDGKNKDKKVEFPVETNKTRNATEVFGNENGSGEKKGSQMLFNASDTTIGYNDDLDYSLSS